MGGYTANSGQQGSIPTATNNYDNNNNNNRSPTSKRVDQRILGCSKELSAAAAASPMHSGPIRMDQKNLKKNKNLCREGHKGICEVDAV